jgi:hypothetical protein
VRYVSQSIIETVEIMDERGNPPSEIVWEIAVSYSRCWDLTERAKLAWQILRGRR